MSPTQVGKMPEVFRATVSITVQVEVSGIHSLTEATAKALERINTGTGVTVISTTAQRE
jgi:hypothetical protein